MSFEAKVKIPSLKEEFTVTATCQECLDAAVELMHDVAENIELSGIGSLAQHMLRDVSPAKAVITNGRGEQINQMSLDNY